MVGMGTRQIVLERAQSNSRAAPCQDSRERDDALTNGTQSNAGCRSSLVEIVLRVHKAPANSCPARRMASIPSGVRGRSWMRPCRAQAIRARYAAKRNEGYKLNGCKIKGTEAQTILNGSLAPLRPALCLGWCVGNARTEGKGKTR